MSNKTLKFKIKCLPASWLNRASSDTDVMFQFCLPNSDSYFMIESALVNFFIYFHHCKLFSQFKSQVDSVNSALLNIPLHCRPFFLSRNMKQTTDQKILNFLTAQRFVFKDSGWGREALRPWRLQSRIPLLKVSQTISISQSLTRHVIGTTLITFQGPCISG